MHLITAKVGPFKSINEAQVVAIEPAITVLVGMNEAGKTVFLQALEKSEDAIGLAAFEPTDDYPRKDLTTYLKQHNESPEEVTKLTYQLSDEEVKEANEKFKTNMPKAFSFTISHDYDNKRTIGISIDEQPVINSLTTNSTLSSDAVAAVKKANSIRAIPGLLKEVSLTNEDKTFLSEIESRIAQVKDWDSVISHEVWKWLDARLPKFLYFAEYDLLHSKMNLQDLASRVEQSKNNPKALTPKHRAMLALLRMADISLTDFTKPGGYEPLKAKIEAVSINLTDQIMNFWKQNEDLEVEVDIKPDSSDTPEYQTGPNIYLRIKNRRHRGVSTPFHQRSRGFIWFFSFLVWFDSVQHQLQVSGEKYKRDLILLLDEPGLSLHALAQADFLKYIDTLAQKHQVIYTTHSPFLVHTDRLSQVRIVEDKDKVGTIISDNVYGADNRAIFPLQVALGWNMAQNLFVSERNLLVEGPSDLMYLNAVSSILAAQGGIGLRDDLTIVPTAGLDKMPTFVALLRANGLKIAVFHDSDGMPAQRLMELVKQKILPSEALLNAAQFRHAAKGSSHGKASDMEDLFDPKIYLEYFNKTFEKQLKGKVVTEKELPTEDTRIICRLEKYLAQEKIALRPSGGFNHYAVASYFTGHPPANLDSETTKRFESLFKAINALFDPKP